MLVAFRDQDANGNGDATDEIPWAGSWSGASAERDPILYAMGYAMSGYLGVNHNGETPVIAYVPYEPAFKDYLLFMNDLWNEKLIDQDMFTKSEAEYQAAVLEGKYGFMAMSAPYVYVPDTKDNWIALNAMAKEEGGIRIYPEATPVRSGACAAMIINADADEEVAAALAALADEMYSVEWYGWAMYGPEAGSDIDYFGYNHYVEDGVVKYHMPDDMTNEWAFRCTYLTFWEMPGFNALQYDPYYQKYAEMYPDTQLGQLFATGNYFEDWQPNFIETYQPYYAECMPNLFFAEEDLDRLNTLKTPLDDYVKSVEAKFITGEMSIESEYDAFVATLESYGVQEYVDIYNKYYQK
jgi:putative aldouronate transport system substrate-binding protein